MNDSQALSELQAPNQPIASPASHQPTKDIAFFNISPARLVMLSLITLNIYSLYWFYRNWVAIKEAENRPIWPFWRAIFYLFFTHSLFKKVYRAANNKGYQQKVPSWYWATAYITLILTARLMAQYIAALHLPVWIYWGLYFLLVFSPMLCLIPIQQAINFHNRQAHYPLITHFAFGEKILLVVCLVFYALLTLAIFFVGKLQWQSPTKHSIVWKRYQDPGKGFQSFQLMP